MIPVQLTSSVIIYEEDGPTGVRVAACTRHAVKLLERSIAEHDDEPDYSTLKIDVKRLTGSRLGLSINANMVGYSTKGDE